MPLFSRYIALLRLRHVTLLRYVHDMLRVMLIFHLRYAIAVTMTLPMLLRRHYFFAMPFRHAHDC